MRDKSKTTDPTSDSWSRPLLIVLSGPSGVGKDTVLNHIKNFSTNLKFVTTITTRPQRSNEKDNVDYHFVNKEEFQKLLKNNDLLESANVYGNWYGVPKEPVRKALKQGNDIMVKVDVQGAASIKKITPQAVFIFLMPPSMEELANRLRQRYTESPETLVVRLRAAVEEIRQAALFDYMVVNHSDQTQSAAAEIQAIITAEKCRIKPREIELL
jgi:guanylate kinase